MKNIEYVSEIMSKDVISLNLSNSLYDAERLFKENNIRHIPVLENKDVIGILSLTDLLRISFVDAYSLNEGSVDTAIYSMLNIEQVMVRDPVKVESMKTVKEVAEILSTNEFHALPVVDNHVLKGIVTTTDLLKYLLNQY
jgi:CBS domain-containing protein